MGSFWFTGSMNRSIPRLISVFFVAVCFSTAVGAQTIITAESYFASVSEAYGAIRDYSANLAITATFVATRRTENMTGRVLFKRPNLLRIDFSVPDNQTIVFNGENLVIYLPRYDVILNQAVDRSSAGSGANLATPQGLALMRRYYTIAYAHDTGNQPQPLQTGSTENVVTLLLSRRTTTEMFRTLRVSVNSESLLIRRIVATTIPGDVIIFDFTGYSTNQGILDSRFVYETPPSANTFNNFLFNE